MRVIAPLCRRATSLVIQPHEISSQPSGDAVVDTVHGMPIADPYRWLEDATKPESQGVDGRPGQAGARRPRASCPGRDGCWRASRSSTTSTRSRRRATAARATSTRARTPTRRRRSSTGRRARTAPRSVLLDPNTLTSRRLDLARRLGAALGRQERSRTRLKPNNSDESHRCTSWTSPPARSPTVDVIAGGKYAAPVVDPDGRRLLLHLGAAASDTVTPAERPGFAEVRFHALGTDPASRPGDARAATGNPQTFLGGELSRDGHWLFASIQHGWNSTDVYFRDLRRARPRLAARWSSACRAVQRRRAGRTASTSRTNDGAPRWRVFRVDPKTSRRAPRWQEIVPERRDAVIETAQRRRRAAAGAAPGCSNASSGLEVRDLDGKPMRKVPLPGIGTVARHRRQRRRGRRLLRASPRSPRRRRSTRPRWPRAAPRCGPRSRCRSTLAPYTVEQVWYPSKDGTKISMFLVHRKDLPKDGSTPFLLDRLRRLQREHDAQLLGGPLSRGSRRAAATRSPTCAAAASTARSGTRRGCASNKQNVFDDFIARRRVPDRQQVHATPIGWRSAAARTAACSSARRSRSAPSCSARSSARCRCST